MSSENIRPEHQQGSPAWLAHRKNHLGASDASGYMGLSPWTTPFQLWSEKVGLQSAPEENYAMRRGTEMEPLARSAFEREYNVRVFPSVRYHETEKYLMASLDGLSLDEKTAVEIKCPGDKAHTMALNGKVPDYYMPQLQQQLAVLSLPMLLYYSFDGYSGVVIEVHRDEEFIDNLLKQAKEFWRRVKEFDPPPYMNRDYLIKDSHIWVEIGNRLYDIEKRKRELKGELETLNLERDTLKEELISDSGSRSCRYDGITLSRSFPKGRIDYKSIPEIQDMDTEVYREKPKEKWTLRVNINQAIDK